MATLCLPIFLALCSAYSRDTYLLLVYHILFTEENFLLFDSGQIDGPHRILIFGRQSNAQWAGSNSTHIEQIYLDGTFRVTPQLYKDGQVDTTLKYPRQCLQQ